MKGRITDIGLAYPVPAARRSYSGMASPLRQKAVLVKADRCTSKMGRKRPVPKISLAKAAELGREKDVLIVRLESVVMLDDLYVAVTDGR